ncbi:hypothetical protein QL285_094962 [Trifolium repens]|nr:hypothetical protein QL285_094962 [Trifolium repens]
MGGFLPITLLIMEVGGGYPLPRRESIRSLGSSSYFCGEGVAPVPRRLEVSFPPSFLFDLNGLEDWAILLLGLCHLFFGP